MNKKIIGEKLIFIRLLTITICSSMFLFSGTQSPAHKPHNPGRDRVFTIMYDGNNGINSYNKNITYAETQNLVDDIAIPRVAIYFQAQTDIGQTFLADTLAYPISPKDTSNTIKLRQNVIKHLVENSIMQREINTLLSQVKNAEAAVMELMTNRDKALESIKIPDLSHLGPLEYVVKPWYVYKQWKEQNPWWNVYDQGQKAIQTAGLAGLTYAQAQKAYNIYTDPNFNLNDPELEKKQHEVIYGNDELENIPIAKQLKDRANKAFDIYASGGIASQEAKQVGTLTYGATATGFSTISSATGIYSDYQRGVKNRDLIHALQQFVIVAEKIDALCKKHGIQTQFTIHSIKDPKGLAMIQGLKHPRYQEKESAVVWTAWVNTFINEIYAQDIYLAPYFGLIAEIDAYNAIATKMITTKDSPHKLCFAQTLNQAKPKFQAKGFWNTVVANPVANSLAEDRNIILTGPNAGGKSTAIRSILQNITLSQTFGIATGELFALTPYDVIHSYLKITDDVMQGLSRYASELKRAGDIVIRAKTLRHDEKFFFALDELFTGTGGKDGEICAYEFVNDDLASFSKQIQFIFATHFDKLKEIGTNNSAMFANYKIDAPITNAQGKLQYPFTLSAGSNNINIAQQMKKEAGLPGNISNPITKPIITPVVKPIAKIVTKPIARKRLAA